MAAKAHATAAHIKSLSNTVRRARPSLLRQAVHACVLPILLYAAEAWWPGKSRPNKGKITSNRVGTHLQKLGVILHIALRGILPVYRTTPLGSLYRESAIPPIEIALNSRTETAAIRLHRLDNRHPLVRRMKCPPTTTQMRFQRLAARAPTNLEWTDPLALPPWEPNESHDAALLRVGHQKDLSKAQAAHAFHN